MMGIDTNILVRYMTRDDEKQARLADRLIESAADASDPLFVNHIVLCELVWVLEKGYRIEKARVVEILGSLLETAAFIIEDKDAATGALQDFRQGGADYADCLIGRRNSGYGCEATFTLDGKAAKMAAFRRP